MHVYIDGLLRTSVPVAADGSWQHALTTPLLHGTHTFAVSQTVGLETSAISALTTIVIDTMAPAAPIFSAPGEGATVKAAKPEFSGTGEAAATVRVIDGTDAVACTATVAADQSWSCVAEIAYTNGSHSFRATATDLAGNQSLSSNPVSVTIDRIAPPVITSPDSGTITSNPRPQLTGTGEAGATITVYNNGIMIDTVSTDAATGTWANTPIHNLSAGRHTLTVTQTDSDGNQSLPSAAVTITVDTTAPDAPVIAAPADGTLSSNAKPEFTGTGEAGAKLVVTDGSDTAVCDTTVEADGSWACTPDTDLADGDHTFTATQTDVAGNKSSPSAPVTFTVDATAPAAPVITSPADSTLINTAKPEFTGTGEAHAKLVVTDGSDTTACDTTVAADGSWTCTATAGLVDGDHTFSATQTDAAGNTSEASAEVTITIDVTTPDAPVITTPADGTLTGNAKPEFTGTGEAGAKLVTKDAAGVTACGTTVAADGSWTCTATAGLVDGDHTFSATQTDAAGNESDLSAPVTFTIDTTPPAPATNTACAQNEDGTITCKGNAELGATVSVSGPVRSPLCTTTVDASGDWSCVSAAPSTVAQVTVTVTDGAGNASNAVTVQVAPYKAAEPKPKPEPEPKPEPKPETKTPAQPATKTGLAKTGTDGGMLGGAAALAAALVLAAGASLTVTRRRRNG